MKLSELGEDGFIAKLGELVPPPGPAVRLSIGDDAAALALPPDEQLLVSADVLVEGVHFARPAFPLHYVGRKAVAVNASDIAAMGGRPLAVVSSLTVPSEAEVEELLELYEGLIGRASELGLDLIGGNLSATQGPLVLDLTILGVTTEGRLLRRAGARPGDALYVSGKLGAAAVGLQLLGEGAAIGDSGDVRACRRALLDPEPRIALGQFLCRFGLATACIDLSDGLARDLARLCRASGVGALVEQSALPIHPGLLSFRVGEAPALALSGGEDYELLFTTSEEASLAGWRAVSELPLTRIGRVTEPGAGIRLRGPDGVERPLLPSGWDHFQAGS